MVIERGDGAPGAAECGRVSGQRSGAGAVEERGQQVAVILYTGGDVRCLEGQLRGCVAPLDLRPRSPAPTPTARPGPAGCTAWPWSCGRRSGSSRRTPSPAAGSASSDARPAGAAPAPPPRPAPWRTPTPDRTRHGTYRRQQMQPLRPGGLRRTPRSRPPRAAPAARARPRSTRRPSPARRDRGRTRSGRPRRARRSATGGVWNSVTRFAAHISEARSCTSTIRRGPLGARAPRRW